MKYLSVLFSACLMFTACTSNNNSSNPAPGASNNDSSTFEVDIAKLQDLGGLQLSTSDSILDFGSTTAAVKTASKTITIKNSGASSVSLSMEPLSDVGGYSVKLNRCGSSVKPKSSCSIDIFFSSRNLYDGAAQDNLILSANGSQLSIQLNAIVTQQPNPQTQDPSLSFNITANSASSQFKTLVVSNAGPGDANNLVITAPNGYGIWINRCPGTLKTGKSCYVTLLYKDYRKSSPTEANISVGAIGVSGTLPAVLVSVISGQTGGSSVPETVAVGFNFVKDLTPGASVSNLCAVTHPIYFGQPMDQYSCMQAQQQLQMNSNCNGPFGGFGQCPQDWSLTPQWTNGSCVIVSQMNPTQPPSDMDCQILNNNMQMASYGQFEISKQDVNVVGSTDLRMIGSVNGSMLAIDSSDGKFVFSDGTPSGTKKTSIVLPLFQKDNFDARVIGTVGSNLYFTNTSYDGDVHFSLWKSDAKTYVTLVGELPIQQVGHLITYNNNILIVGQRNSDSKGAIYSLDSNGAIIDLYPNLSIPDWSGVKLFPLAHGLTLAMNEATEGIEGGLYKISADGSSLVPAMGTNLSTNTIQHLRLQYVNNVGGAVGQKEDNPMSGVVTHGGAVYIFDDNYDYNGGNPIYTNHVVYYDGQEGFMRNLSGDLGDISYTLPMVDDAGNLFASFTYGGMPAGPGLYKLGPKLSTDFVKVLDDADSAGTNMMMVNSKLFATKVSIADSGTNIYKISNGSISASLGFIDNFTAASATIGKNLIFSSSHGTMLFNSDTFALSYISVIPGASDVNDIAGLLAGSNEGSSAIKISTDTYVINTNTGSADVGKEIYVLKIP